MKRTISAMMGKGSLNHNSRKFHAENTDPARSHLNIEYCNEDIRTVYHELFDEAAARYNAKQKRQDRRIDDYYEKIRTGKQEKIFHELVIQIGDKDNMSALTEDGKIAQELLDEYMRDFQQRNPTLRVFAAHLHMDEATPHLHIDFVPYVTGWKGRGLDTRVSLKQALAHIGFVGGTRGDTEWNQWSNAEKEQLAQIMQQHGIDWEKKDSHEDHLSVLDFKKQERSREIVELEVVKEKKQQEAHILEAQLQQLAPAVEKMEKLAADFSSEPDKVLPPPSALESARAYREKKAIPIFKVLIKTMRAIYRNYLDMKGKFQNLLSAYEQKCAESERLGKRLQEVGRENRKLQGQAADLGRARKALGTEVIERAINEIKVKERNVRQAHDRS